MKLQEFSLLMLAGCRDPRDATSSRAADNGFPTALIRFSHLLLRSVSLLAIAGLLTTAGLKAQEHADRPEQTTLPPADKSATAATVPWLQSVFSEIRKLRLELLQYRMELLESWLPELERNLQQVQTEQQALDEEQRLKAEEVSQIDLHLAQQVVEKQERDDLDRSSNS